MSYKDLEDSIHRLVMDFTNQERQFLDEMLELNAYDTVLRQNQQKVRRFSKRPSLSAVILRLILAVRRGRGDFAIGEREGVLRPRSRGDRAATKRTGDDGGAIGEGTWS